MGAYKFVCWFQIIQPLIIPQLYQCADGLAYIHGESIVHGDLHAGNILIDKHGQARLADFGLSNLTTANLHEYGPTHERLGVSWMAPELLKPEQFGLTSMQSTPASDVYAFGCTGYEVGVFHDLKAV